MKLEKGPTDTTVYLLLKLPFITSLFSSTFLTLNGPLLAHRKSGKKIRMGSGNVYSPTIVQMFLHICATRAMIWVMAIIFLKNGVELIP